MKLKHILDSVRVEIPSSRCACRREQAQVSGAMVWTGGYIPEGVVVVFPGPVPANPVSNCTCCLCLQSDQPCSDSWITVPDMQTLWAAFNCIQTYFAKAQEVAGLVMPQRKGTIEELVGQASAILGNPILVADMKSNIIAMTDIDLEDSAWQRFRELRRVPYHPDRVKMEQEDNTSREPVMIDGLQKKNFFIKCVVRNSRADIAELQIFSLQRDFLPVDLEYAALLSNAVALDILGQSSLESDLHNSSDYLIYELIRGRLNDPEEIARRMEEVGWELKDVLYVLIVTWGHTGRNIDYRDACMRTLTAMIPNARSIMEGPEMIILFDREEELNHLSKPVQDIRNYLERAHLRGVLSLPFHGAENAAYRYRQSREMLKMAFELGNTDAMFMAESAMFDLLLHEASVRYQLIDYVHPLVRRLQEYDLQEGKDLCDTLRAFSLSGYSYTQAATLLHTHRNTVIYRMRQIENILQHTFENDGFAFQIELSFRILDYLKKLGEEAREQILLERAL